MIERMDLEKAEAARRLRKQLEEDDEHEDLEKHISVLHHDAGGGKRIIRDPSGL